MERRITYLVSAVSTTRTLMSVVLIILAILTTNAEASTTTALIPTPAEPHGYTLLASFSTSTITLTTTIPDSGWSYTNAADTWLVVSLDLRYRSSGGAVSTQTVEVSATAFLTISGESVTFRVSTTTLAAHSAYTNVCNQCSPDGGTPGCKCDNIVSYRVVSANSNENSNFLPDVKYNLERANGTVINNLIFTRSTNPSDVYDSESSYAIVPLSTPFTTNIGYTMRMSCLEAGLIPAMITSDDDNDDIEDDLVNSYVPLMDIDRVGINVRWIYSGVTFATCVDITCTSPQQVSGRFNKLESTTEPPLVFNDNGKWRDFKTPDSALCAYESTTRNSMTTVRLDINTTTPIPPPTTTTTTTTTPPANTTTTTPNTTTTTASSTTDAPTNTTEATPPLPTSTTPPQEGGQQYRVQITLASQVHDVHGVASVLSRMFKDSMNDGTVTILELVPGSTVVVAQADNVDESDMDRLRADIETGASELVTVFGAIASSLRIDRIFPSHPGLAAAATALLLVTMLACVVACVVGCVMYARESIRRTNELREEKKAIKSTNPVDRNITPDVFSISGGQLRYMGNTLKQQSSDLSPLEASTSELPAVSGPLDNSRANNRRMRLESANAMWASSDMDEEMRHQEASPRVSLQYSS